MLLLPYCPFHYHHHQRKGLDVSTLANSICNEVGRHWMKKVRSAAALVLSTPSSSYILFLADTKAGSNAILHFPHQMARINLSYAEWFTLVNLSANCWSPFTHLITNHELGILYLRDTTSIAVHFSFNYNPELSTQVIASNKLLPSRTMYLLRYWSVYSGFQISNSDFLFIPDHSI